MEATGLFKSFFHGGFECSTHRLRNGRRLDLVAGTDHDKFVEADYRRLQQYGIRTVREGIRWHLIEERPGRYDFSSVLPTLRAAEKTGTQVIWDLFHFGWPDDIDVFTPEFLNRFGRLSSEFAKLLSQESSAVPFIAPANEISFFSWAGGDVAYVNPFASGRGAELKHQLVRAAIEGIEAVWSVSPQARIVIPDPVIHIVADPSKPDGQPAAENYRCSQFEAWDMLAGRSWPQLGGQEKYLDIIGVNFYDRNEWIHNSKKSLQRTDPLYRPFQEILLEVYERYRRPIFVAETGTENAARVDWFSYIVAEVRAAMSRGVPIEGICLYPILNHPGWDDDRHCYNGLFDYANAAGEREVYEPLAAEINKYSTQDWPKQASSQANVLPALLCFSHLRWDSVFQRPQHLMSRFARERKVFFVEEPVLGEGRPRLAVRACRQTGVLVVTPHLPDGMLESDTNRTLADLIDGLIGNERIHDYLLWYYTPMAVTFTGRLTPLAVIYDCMDELTGFRGAPASLSAREARLFEIADLVFTGGQSLYEAKRDKHARVYAFPSSVDVPHFSQARTIASDPADQASIPHPRLGYAGVIDERMDLALLHAISELRPDWHLVMLGPVAKLDPSTLPKSSNIHYLGAKKYDKLPSYLAGWDVAMLPFARNDSTRFISPTKTPEYLAAGRPVVSTSIRDVIRPYGELKLVHIADRADEFVAAAERAISEDRSNITWLARVDDLLQTMSWDSTWTGMVSLIDESIRHKKRSSGSGRTAAGADAPATNFIERETGYAHV